MMTLSSNRVDRDIVYVVWKTWQDMFQPITGFNDSAGVAGSSYLIPNVQWLPLIMIRTIEAHIW